MSPYSCAMLLRVRPILMAAIARGAVKPTGCEDTEELSSEGFAMAATMLESVEAREKIVSPGNVAYYVLQAMKSGRRSGYSGRQDAMCPSAQLDNVVEVSSMDEQIGNDDDPMTLHDCLAGMGEDPATMAGRNLDWGLVMERLNSREQYVVRETGRGTEGLTIAAALKVSTPRVVQIKREVSRKIRAAWGEIVVADVTGETRWQRHVRAMMERRTCRACRAA